MGYGGKERMEQCREDGSEPKWRSHGFHGHAVRVEVHEIAFEEGVCRAQQTRPKVMERWKVSGIRERRPGWWMRYGPPYPA